MLKRTARTGVSLMTLLGLAACADRDNTGPGLTANGAPREQQEASLATVESSGEELFVELSRIAPSSAGFVYEGAKLVVLVADTSERAVAERFVARAAREGRILPPGGGRRIESIGGRKVRYSFRALSAIRSQVDDLLLGMDRDLQFLDLDEAANTVTLGYSGDSSAVIARVKQLLALTPANEQALRVARVSGGRTQSSALTSAAAAMDPGNLGWPNTPLVGGLRIHRAITAPHFEICTLGFTAKRDGVVGFVTNSHCTEDMYGMGGI